MNDIKIKPRQKTEYVVRAGESDGARAVYRGDGAAAAHNVAKSIPDATVTFRSKPGFRKYIAR